MNLQTLPFSIVDVFAHEPLSGNGLSVFILQEELPASAMQRITQEMRQFETIFLQQVDGTARFTARIFTMEEELPFAGHPIIGAAALVHSELFADQGEVKVEFVLQGRKLHATSRFAQGQYHAEMEQGDAEFQPPLSADQSRMFLRAMNLSVDDQVATLPLQVVSTGLPYLMVPIQSGLERTRIVARDFEALLATVGAKFAYALHVADREARTWDNDGRVEDIATGSAAGPAAAYLVHHGLAAAGDDIVVRQGRFLGRPSQIHATVQGGAALSVRVRGQVCWVGSGALRLPRQSLKSNQPQT